MLQAQGDKLQCSFIFELTAPASTLNFQLQSPTFSSRDSLQLWAQTCIPLSASSLQTIANSCKKLQTIANNCKQMQTIANNCKQLQTNATSLKTTTARRAVFRDGHFGEKENCLFENTCCCFLGLVKMNHCNKTKWIHFGLGHLFRPSYMCMFQQEEWRSIFSLEKKTNWVDFMWKSY